MSSPHDTWSLSLLSNFEGKKLLTAALSPDNTLLVAVNLDQGIDIITIGNWDSQIKVEFVVPDDSFHVHKILWCPGEPLEDDHHMLVLATVSGHVHLLDVNIKKNPAPTRSCKFVDHKGYISSMAFSPTGHQLAVAVDSVIHIHCVKDLVASISEGLLKRIGKGESRVGLPKVFKRQTAQARNSSSSKTIYPVNLVYSKQLLKDPRIIGLAYLNENDIVLSYRHTLFAVTPTENHYRFLWVIRTPRPDAMISPPFLSPSADALIVITDEHQFMRYAFHPYTKATKKLFSIDLTPTDSTNTMHSFRPVGAAFIDEHTIIANDREGRVAILPGSWTNDGQEDSISNEPPPLLLPGTYRTDGRGSRKLQEITHLIPLGVRDGQLQFLILAELRESTAIVQLQVSANVGRLDIVSS